MKQILKILTFLLLLATVLSVMTCDGVFAEAVYYKNGVDPVPPVPGNEGNTALVFGTETIDVSWTKATDNVSPQGALEYAIFYTDDQEATTASAIAAYEQYVGWTTDVDSGQVTGLIDNRYYNVVVAVRDENGKTGYYDVKTDGKTQKHPRIFWTDAGSDKIRCADLNGQNPVDIVDSGITNPYAISVDPVNRQVYFTVKGASPAIYRVDFNSENLTPLITSGLSDPCGIAVDYINGYLFWTDINENNIYRSSLTPSSANADTYKRFGDDTPYPVYSPMGHRY